MKTEIEVQGMKAEKVCPSVAQGELASRHQLTIAPRVGLVCATCGVAPITLRFLEVDEETFLRVGKALATEQEASA
jgi:hypothetical protein